MLCVCTVCMCVLSQTLATAPKSQPKITDAFTKPKAQPKITDIVSKEPPAKKAPAKSKLTVKKKKVVVRDPFDDAMNVFVGGGDTQTTGTTASTKADSSQDTVPASSQSSQATGW